MEWLRLWPAAWHLSRRRRFRAFLRAAFLIVGGIGAYLAAIAFEEGEYICALVPSSFLLIAALAELVLADIITEAKYPVRTETVLDRLDRNLAEFHAQIRDRMGELIGSLQACDTSAVSGTLHLVVEMHSAIGDKAETALLQITDYAGALGGRRWRFTSSSKGLIGRCLRTKRSEWANFSSIREYRQRMTNEFGYSEHEAFEHTFSARSYWAEPVLLHGQLIGVLFLFSTENQIFPLAISREAARQTANQIAGLLEVASIV